MCVAWCTGPRKYYSKDADSKLAVVWLILVQPLLFGAIGIEIDFRLIQGSLIWKTVVILALGAYPLPPPCLPSRLPAFPAASTCLTAVHACGAPVSGGCCKFILLHSCVIDNRY